jgi:hypothetical protein
MNAIYFLRSVNIGLNICGYVPIVSSVTGPLRQSYGVVYIVSAVALALLAVQNPVGIAAECAGSICIAGIMHVLRGTVETVPVINCTCAVYDFFRVCIGGSTYGSIL